LIDLRDDWPEVLRRMQGARAIGVLLSVEDALCSPAEPGSVRKLSPEGREKLASLAARKRIFVALHSGERLSDLAEDVRVSGIWYIANRGFELRDPQGGEIRFYGPEDVRLMDRIHEELLLQTAHLAGVELFHRGPCLAVDYAQVDSPLLPVVLDLFRNVIAPSLGQVTVLHGRNTIEARLRSPFDEKTALRYVHRRLIPGTPFFYFGSDPALLQMFDDYRPFDIRVQIGGGPNPSARYRLEGSPQVIDVLGRIATQWADSAAP
jgi:trehalose-phosphatase